MFRFPASFKGVPMTEFDKNQTSAAFLAGVLERRAAAAEPGSDAQTRHELGFDVYIKARSYAILNKIAFWLAFGPGLCVFLWPAIAVFMKDAAGLKLLASAVTQTMITALASFFILIYQHYKGRQGAAENLLRAIVFNTTPVTELADTVITEMAKIDKGIGFNLKSGPKS